MSTSGVLAVNVAAMLVQNRSLMRKSMSESTVPCKRRCSDFSHLGKQLLEAFHRRNEERRHAIVVALWVK